MTAVAGTSPDLAAVAADRADLERRVEAGLDVLEAHLDELKRLQGQGPG